MFGGYVSGAAPIEERQEIQDLIAFVRENKVDYCVATEISRVSRDLITGVQIIRTLAEAGVNLYLANYGLETLDKDGKISPITSLILTITLEISSMERQQIRMRMQQGYQSYLQRRRESKDAHPLGRPADYRKSEEEYMQLASGLAARTGARFWPQTSGSQWPHSASTMGTFS